MYWVHGWAPHEPPVFVQDESVTERGLQPDSAGQAARGLQPQCTGVEPLGSGECVGKETQNHRFLNYLFTCLAWNKDVINCDLGVKGLLIRMKIVILGLLAVLLAVAVIYSAVCFTIRAAL